MMSRKHAAALGEIFAGGPGLVAPVSAGALPHATVG